MPDMAIYLGGVLMPKYLALEEIVKPNANEVMSLDGTLRVDFVNTRRGWRLKWGLITVADYQTIRDKFDEQFETGNMHWLNIPAYNVYVQVYMKIDNKKIKHNGNFVDGIEVELYEQYAIS